MLIHRQLLRRWAARVLLAWLFGVVAGVANACLLAQATVAVAAHAGPGAGAHAHAGHAAPQRGGDSDDPQAACHAFCEQTGATVPTASSLMDKADAAAAVPAVLMPQPAFERGLAVAMAARPLWPGPPTIPIAFLRLAL